MIFFTFDTPKNRKLLFIDNKEACSKYQSITNHFFKFLGHKLMLDNENVHISYNLTTSQFYPVRTLKMYQKRHVGVVKVKLKIKMCFEK